MEALPPDPLVDRIALQDALHQIGSRMRPADVAANLLQVGENLTALRRSGVDVQRVAEMYSDDSHNLSSTQLLGYLGDLASLQRQGIEGVAELFAHSHQVWNARRMGDETQNVIGFLIEANVALRLQANGYRLIALSKTLASGFEYDIIAQSPQGAAVGIEVKRSLATILGKNDGVWNRDRLERTQLWRHCAAALADNLTPVIAVSSGGTDNWSSNAVGHMIQAVAEQLKVRPLVINGLTGTRVRI
jgi:Holliday junction resolvase-like predicted endonuclease